jgi:hypothetical protein
MSLLKGSYPIRNRTLESGSLLLETVFTVFRMLADYCLPLWHSLQVCIDFTLEFEFLELQMRKRLGQLL